MNHNFLPGQTTLSIGQIQVSSLWYFKPVIHFQKSPSSTLKKIGLKIQANLILEYRLGAAGGQRYIPSKNRSMYHPLPHGAWKYCTSCLIVRETLQRWCLLGGIHSNTRSLISQSQSQKDEETVWV